MKFPGQRKSKHYFPVSERELVLHASPLENPVSRTHVIGIDQVVVDIEANVTQELIDRYGLKTGESFILEEDKAELLYEELKTDALITSEYAGGTIGNTLHNYSVLADSRSVLFGVMSENIKIGSYGYRYLCNTSSRVDLNYLQAVDGPIGRCFTLITDDGERTFAISEGRMNQLNIHSIPTEIFKDASALVISAYLMRCKSDDTIKHATLKAIELAHAASVPVVLTLGTRSLIAQDPEFWQQFITEHVTVLAMNEDEAHALTGEVNPILAADKALEWADLVLCTAGPIGLYMAGYTEDSAKRETSLPLLSGSITEFNQYEFSRPMQRKLCDEPIKVYSHISPYMGGPLTIKNTNGAGDAALAALLHDMAANKYHQSNVPNSVKHQYECLTYSSFSHVCRYANRASYEVLAQHSPRLSRGLPEREDSLEEAYWDR